jgi:hypothetical protein
LERKGFGTPVNDLDPLERRPGNTHTHTHTHKTAEPSMTASVVHGRHPQLVSNFLFGLAIYIYIIAKTLEKKYKELKIKSYFRSSIAITKPKHSFLIAIFLLLHASRLKQ